MVLLGLFVLIGFAYLAITGLMARSQLQQARAAVATLRAHIASGDLAAADADVRRIADHAGSAHALTSGPVWALAADLPAGGEPVETFRGLAAAVDRLGHSALPALVTARRDLAPASLRTADGRIDVARIQAAAPGIEAAATTFAQVLRTVDALPAHTWLGAVDDARRESLDALGSVDGTVGSADLAARILPSALGVHRTERYFVAFQNNAEARGTGGLPGAFGILAVTDGRARFERFESDDALDGVHVDVDLGTDFTDLYSGADPTGLYVNSNLSPNFPYAARIWASMWQRKSGERLDGAIALDPTALSYLLGATGPATLSDGTRVTADDVVALTESTVYRRFDGRNAARRAFLRDVAAKASAAIVGARGSAGPLVDAITQAAGERRLLVWSADPAVESLLGRTSFGGVVPVTDRPYAGLSIVNDGGNKLDYYLDRSVRWQRTGCGAVRTVTATVRLANGAPTGLPAYVTSRSDVHRYPVRPGDNRLLVSWYATSGAQLDSVTVDGAATGAHVGAERGHPVYTVDVELPRGATRTVVLHLSEPGTAGPPVVLRQPLVRPLTVQIDDARCG